MTITGRLTATAVINILKDNRRVVNFSIAVNDYYRPKGREKVKQTAFYHCSYWISSKVAAHLKKGTLIAVSGRIYVTAFAGTDRTAKASLNCHVNHLNVLAWPKEVEVIGKAAQAPLKEENADEVPF